MNEWFFLSYARENLENYVRRFYRDLNKTIQSLTKPGEGIDGFFDERTIELGQPWPEELSSALQSCKVFVSLYSPAYFAKDYCGREWQVFSTRQAAHTPEVMAHEARPSSMLPILWVPESSLPRPLPKVASDLQYTHGDFGELYARVGLRQLMMLQKYRDHYREFLARFADKLIQTANKNPLPPDPNPQPITEVENAFQRQPGPTIKPSSYSNEGPRYVQFVFVAGRRDELRGVREKLDPYGERGGRDWQPYLPDVPEEVGIIAQKITADEQFHFDAVPLDDAVIARIEEAERQNNIVAIVVDTWSLCLERYKTAMREFDGRKFLNCVVFVSWNSRDDETESKRADLIDELNATFLYNCIERNPNCFLEVGSHDEFKKELPAALHKALQRIVQKAGVVKKAQGRMVISKPIITGVRRGLYESG